MGRCEAGSYSLDYADEDTLSAADLEQRKVLACQTRVRSDAAFYFDFASTLCHAAAAQAHSGVVRELRLLSEDTALLRLDAGAAGRQLDFLPGQYARLQVPGSDCRRAYSFANRPNPQNHLQFLIRLLPGGAMSDYLRQGCRVGDEIRFEAPLGTFYLRQVERPLLLVAGGTGLSAFLGMLDELAERGCERPVHLYWYAAPPISANCSGSPATPSGFPASASSRCSARRTPTGTAGAATCTSISTPPACATKLSTSTCAGRRRWSRRSASGCAGAPGASAAVPGEVHRKRRLMRSAEVAASYRQGHAGDVGRLVGGEEKDRRDLLVDAAVALHQAAVEGLLDDLSIPAPLLLALRRGVARNPSRRRVGAARRHRVDADALVGGLERQAGGQRVHPALGGAIGHPVDPRVATDETLTIAPLPCPSIAGSAARQHHKVGSSERRSSASISSSA